MSAPQQNLMNFSHLTDLEQQSLYPTAADVLGFLRAKRSFDDDFVWYQQHQLARILHLSRHQVRRATAHLLRRNLIEIWNANMSPAMYRASSWD